MPHLTHFSALLALTITLGLSGAASAQSLFNGGGNTGSARGGAASGTGAATPGGGVSTDAGTRAANTDFGNGFVGRSDNAGRFVGNSQATTGTNVQQGNRNLNSNRNRNPGETKQAQREFRVRLQAGFAFPSRSQEGLRTVLASRFTKIQDRVAGARQIDVQVGPAGSVILNGRVSDARSKRVMETLVKLEAGVRSVQNNLIVEPFAE